MNPEQLKRCLVALQGALKASALYPEGHPAIQNPLRDLAQDLEQLLAAGRPIVLGIVDDVLVLDELPFYETDGLWHPLFAALRGRGVESISFQPGISAEQLLGIIRILKGGDPDGASSLAEAWKAQKITHASYRELVEGDGLRAQAQRMYEESLGITIDLMTELRMGRVPRTEAAVHIVDDMRDLVQKDQNAMLGMTMMKAYDEHTYNHLVNISIFCLAFGHHLELPPDELRGFGLAGLFHDIGMVRIEEAIITKPGALSAEELRRMQLHPELGAEILSSMEGISPDVLAMVLQHHVRFDRKGYPKLPVTLEIHPLAEAVALADAYDALTTTRPYQRARHPSDAIRIVRRGNGAAYRSELVDGFVTMLGAHPTAETVRLSSGEIAVVVGDNALDPAKPVVRLVIDAAGNRLASSQRLELADESARSRTIVSSVDPLTKGIDLAAVLEEEIKE